MYKFFIIQISIWQIELYHFNEQKKRLDHASVDLQYILITKLADGC